MGLGVEKAKRDKGASIGCFMSGRSRKMQSNVLSTAVLYGALTMKG
jgi:hypothetical protein